MGEKTQHEVQTVFKASDGGFGSTIGSLGNKLNAGAHHLGEFRSKFREFRQEQGFSTVAMLGLGVGIGGMIEKLRETQKEFGLTQKSIAGVISGSLQFEKSATDIDRYRRSMVLSKTITEELEHTSGRFNVGLEDTANTYRGISVAAGKLGLTQQQVMELTVDAAAAAKRYGVAGEQAAVTISRGLATGAVRGFGPFEDKMRSALGNMKKLSQAARFEHIKKALSGSVDVAEEMGKGIGGAMTRAQMAVTEVLRESTGPLFLEISKSLEQWSRSIRAATEAGKPLVEQFSGKLVTAFHTLEKVAGFIKDHFIAINGIFLGLKMQSLGASIGGAAAGLGGSLGAAGGVLSTFVTKVGGAASAAALLATAAAGAAEVIGEHLLKTQKTENKAQGAIMGVPVLERILATQKAGPLSAGQIKIAERTIAELKGAGVFSEGKLSRDNLAQTIHEMSADAMAATLDRYGIKPGVFESSYSQESRLADAIAARIEPAVTMLGSLVAPVVSAAVDDKDRKFSKPPVYDFRGSTINMKFEDNDPDRIFVRALDEIENVVHRRTQSPYSEPLSD